jgi:hypothetical protein
MASLVRIVSRTLFWSYERGTWQYDIAVVLILVFVLLTPRSWFRDQAQVGAPAAPGQVELVADSGKARTYRVDARILALPEQAPQLQNELHNAMQRALPDLQNGRFSISRIEAVRNDQGAVIAYEVDIQH